MTQMPDSATWARLGEHLRRRRLEISQRYANFTLFADERGINYRVAWDAEHGARTNFRGQTRRQIEVAYQLDLGWIDRFLAGEEAAPGRLTAMPARDHLDELLAKATPERRNLVAAFMETLDRLDQQQNSERRGA